MLTEGRAQRIRHSFHSLPRSRLDSMDRLEKYSLLLKKEKQVIEKSEKAARLAAKCFTSFDESSLEELPEPRRQSRASLYGTLPRLRRNTDAGRCIPFERPSLIASKSMPESADRRLPSSWFTPTHKQAPTVRWKDRPHSVVVTARFQEARDRHDKRRERVKSLEEDCVRATKILAQMKAISMPSLSDQQQTPGRTLRRLSCEADNDGLPIGYLVPREGDIIEC